MNRYAVKYTILLIIQILLINYLSVSQFVMVVFMPVMILCLPSRVSTTKAMIIAFFSGLAVDFLSASSLGLCSAALVLSAFARKFVCTLIFGSELFARGETITFARQGWKKIYVSNLILSALFFLVFIAIDSAGTRPLWIDAVKFVASLLIGSLVSIYIASILCTEPSSRWK